MPPAPRRAPILSALIRWADDWIDRLALAIGIVAALSAIMQLGETITR